MSRSALKKNQRSPRNTTFRLESLCARIDVDALTTTTERCRLRSVNHTQTASYGLFGLVGILPCDILSCSNLFLGSISSCISFGVSLSGFGFLIEARSGHVRRHPDAPEVDRSEEKQMATAPRARKAVTYTARALLVFAVTDVAQLSHRL